MNHWHFTALVWGLLQTEAKISRGLFFLHYSEGVKAADTFMKAIPNVPNEEFMLHLLRPDQDNLHHIKVLYYLKV